MATKIKRKTLRGFKYGKPKWQNRNQNPVTDRIKVKVSEEEGRIDKGIANDKTQNRLSKLINKWDPDIVGIAEAMITPRDISSAYLQSLGMSASFYFNDRHNSVPNIWLLWKSTVSTPTLLQQSSQQITVE
ncbi:hypothetical protein IFM89_036476, partial [Coptis chinensis]